MFTQNNYTMKSQTLAAMMLLANILSIKKLPIQTALYYLQDMAMYTMSREVNKTGKCGSYEDTVIALSNKSSQELWQLDSELLPF